MNFVDQATIVISVDTFLAFVLHIKGEGSLRCRWLSAGRRKIPYGGQSSAHLIRFGIEVERRILDVI